MKKKLPAFEQILFKTKILIAEKNDKIKAT